MGTPRYPSIIRSKRAVEAHADSRTSNSSPAIRTMGMLMMRMQTWTRKNHDCSPSPASRIRPPDWPTARLKEASLKRHPSFKRVPQDDRVVAFGAGGNKVNACFGEFLDLLQILLRIRRQLVKA